MSKRNGYEPFPTGADAQSACISFSNVFSDIPYDSLEKALEGDRTKSEFYTLLNGEWDFRYFERDIDCPKKIEAWDKVS